LSLYFSVNHPFAILTWNVMILIKVTIW
jgi:hypothetical protein